MLIACGSMQAQDMMNIKFTNNSTQSYDVTMIDEITFTEDTSGPITPPAADNVKVTAINNSKFEYDVQGRLTAFIDGDELDTTFDYATGTMKMMGFPIGSFSLNSAGFFSQMKIDFMGSTATMDFTYDGQGRLTGVSAVAQYGFEKETSVSSLNWENGLLVNICANDDGDIDFCYYEYSDVENVHNQWTVAMSAFEADDFDDGDEENMLSALLLSNMLGTAPARYVSSYHWDDERPCSVAYTFNSDNCVATEKIGSTLYTYKYAAGKSSAPADKERISRALRKLLPRRR